MSKHLVKCYYCNQTFDINKEPFIKVNARRYAHKDCNYDKMSPENRDKDKFFKTVKQIYGSNYNFVLINQQANDYIQQYNYTWSGMTGCLHWFYNIKHGSLEEGHGGIGIIPFIYDECRKYYEKIYKTQEKNKDKNIQSSIIEFNIQSPKPWNQLPHLLDLEENNND